jgi:hypothetical protein
VKSFQSSEERWGLFCPRLLRAQHKAEASKDPGEEKLPDSDIVLKREISRV